MDAPTREVFGNVAPWMQVVFYALMLIAHVGGGTSTCIEAV